MDVEQKEKLIKLERDLIGELLQERQEKYELLKDMKTADFVQTEKTLETMILINRKINSAKKRIQKIENHGKY